MTNFVNRIPWTQHCRPDVIRYDFVIRVEQLAEDFTQYFGTKIQIRKQVDNNEVNYFMKTLNHQQIQGLKNLYKNDLKYMNYTENIYF